MAYDVELSDRIREILQGESGLTERRMFGGLAFLVSGNMAVAASDRGIMVRVDPARTESLVDEPRVRRMVMRGRELDGWLRVEPAVVEDDDALRDWVGRGVAHARSLPPK